MTKPGPLSLTMIVRDEAERLGPLLARVRPHVAEIVIVDTGSTDRTVAIAHEAGADRVDVLPPVHPAFDVGTCEHPRCVTARDHAEDRALLVDFAAARNEALSLATQPWVLWLDADDEIEGLDALAERLQCLEPDPDVPAQIAIWYDHESLGDLPDGPPKGAVVTRCLRERVVSRAHHRWVAPVHEVLVPWKDDQPYPLATVRRVEDYGVEGVRVVHRRREQKKITEPHRNLRILEHGIDGASLDQVEPRMRLHLGIALEEAGEVQAADAHLRSFLRVHPKGPHTFEAARLLFEKALLRARHGREDERRGAVEDVLGLSNAALRAAPHLCEASLLRGLAWSLAAEVTGARASCWTSAVEFLQRGLDRASTGPYPLFFVPEERTRRARHALCAALQALERFDEARAVARDGLRDHPEDPGFRSLLSSPSVAVPNEAPC